ncbi:MMPL family transporter [Nocardia takedensis]|uniref:MMPL family transporter n=1 Tax=Nocardia takedensis TaxID=259390 RepID=UPI000312A4CE|nr:MMPL family transporter [Nocardia takedensis]
MFTWWGDLVSRIRFVVIGVVGAAMLGLAWYGVGLEDHLSSGGMFDPGAESSEAARIADAAFGRNHDADVLVLYTAPQGKTVDDPEFASKVVESLNGLPKRYPEQITGVNAAYWRTETGKISGSRAATEDRRHAIAAIAIRGDDDTTMVRNYRAVRNAFAIPGVDVRVGGLQPVAGELNDTIAADIHRMELLAFPVVGVLLFFIFGGLIAAALPLIVGGLTVFGVVMLLTEFTEVASFVSAVVSMIGFGLAIDYGLFIVSRFREELAEGFDTPAAVRRTVMTAGRTVVFSATMIIASLGGMLLFPQGFLKSIAYGAIATVSMAALTAITILPAILAVLGHSAPGLAAEFAVPSQSPSNPEVFRTTAALTDSDDAGVTIEYLRALEQPDSARMLVGGVPALQKDIIDALLFWMPWMIIGVVLVTTLLMFLTFGSLVLPIKAALMSALGLGSTLGILTWIFIDGHGAGPLNFTPQPITAPVLVVIIAIIYGLSTDYEVFLLSRMVEARAQGASTAEAIRVGTAHTGRIITAAALILLVVVGAFAFSDLVMMQYIAFGMIAALLIDATVLRMILVPATMKLLGEDCWWAPPWMKRLQRKAGLGESILADAHPRHADPVDLVLTTPVTDPVTLRLPIPEGVPASQRPQADTETPTR